MQRGCGLRRSSLVGLRRRNNEFNELTNCYAAWVLGFERPALQGVSVYVLIPRALPWATDLLGFQPVLGRHNLRPPHFASKVSYSASPQSFAACSRSAYSFRVPLWGGWAAACGCCARDKWFVLWMLAFFVVDVFGLTKGQKNGIPLYPDLVNLKSNTMKNTLQI